MSRAPDDEKYRRILETAYREFNLHGYRLTTIKTISDQAGISPGSVYTYFSNKAELFKHSIQYLWEKIYLEVDLTLASSEAFNIKFFKLYDRVAQYLLESQVFLMGMFSGESRRKKLRQNVSFLCEKLLPLFLAQDSLFFKPKGSHAQQLFTLKIILTGALFDGVTAGADQMADVFSQLRTHLAALQGWSPPHE